MVTAFTMAPVLQLLNHNREVVIETNTSVCVSGRVVPQYDDDKVLHPVVYSQRHVYQQSGIMIYIIRN